MADAQASASETSSDPRRWRALWVLLLGQFAALVDVSVTNVALPSIGRSTGSSPSELQWIVTGYVLAFGLMPIIGGRLGDIGGRRRIFIVGLVGFVVASAAVGLSPDPLFIIVARVVQGLFCGVLGPPVSGYIQNAFPRSERGGRSDASGSHSPWRRRSVLSWADCSSPSAVRSSAGGSSSSSTCHRGHLPPAVLLRFNRPPTRAHALPAAGNWVRAAPSGSRRDIPRRGLCRDHAEPDAVARGCRQMHRRIGRRRP